MAVFTSLSRADFDQVSQVWPIGNIEKYQGMTSGVENTTYVVYPSKSKYILTLIEKRTQKEDLEYFSELQRYFFLRGIPCPTVVLAHGHKNYQEILGKPAVMTTFLGGSSPEIITTEACAQMGALLGRMHGTQRDFPLRKDNPVSLDSLEDIWNQCHQTDASIEISWVLLREELTLQKQFSYDHLTRGTIHADAFPDNVFFDDQGQISGIIDWYFACYGFLLYDVALTLVGWCYDEARQWRPARAGAFLRAYLLAFPEGAFEDADLRGMLRRACLRIAMTRLYDQLHPRVDGLVTPKSPLDFLNFLKEHRAGPVLHDGLS
jgi:homoserine kinase type II